MPIAAHVECDSGGSDHCMVVADLYVGTRDGQAQQVANTLQALVPRSLKGGDAPW